MQQRLIELEHQSRVATEDLVNLSELKQRELTLKEECAYKGRLQTQFDEEQRRIRTRAESVITARGNKMQIDFDEKYHSKLNVTQAELDSQFALLQSEREKMRLDWNSIMSIKDKEIEILKQRLLETQKAPDRVSRPGSSHDVPVHAAAATSIVTKVMAEIINEERDPKPQPARVHGGGGGDRNDPGDPSGNGRASKPDRRENNKPNPGNPGGPDDPNPPDSDPWDALPSAPESLRAVLGRNKNSKESEKVILQALPKAHMLRQWKLIVRKTIFSASVEPDSTWLWLLEIEKCILIDWHMCPPPAAQSHP